MKNLFLLDPQIHFLNHGSFGACPKPVFSKFQQLQRELESRPLYFLDRNFVESLKVSRSILANYLDCDPQNLVYFTNPTTAINMVARNLKIGPWDEVLASNHEYGTMDRTWQYICQKKGALYINHPITLPISSHEKVVEEFWQGVTKNTKVIFLSHITSQTALIFPLKEICDRARERGILTVIDGAHAPGQIPLNLTDLGADIYAGSCHKWLCAPKGSAFLYVAPHLQAQMEPLIVSWGYQSKFPGESKFIDTHEWQGTRDICSFLSVPHAIDFQEKHDWNAVRKECSNLLAVNYQKIIDITKQEPICLLDENFFLQMAAFKLPSNVDINSIKRELYNDFHVEIPVYNWNGSPFFRLSVQAYNTQTDLDALLNGLSHLLNKPS